MELVVDGKTHADYRRGVSDAETIFISMWQHLAIGDQTCCDRCMAVGPAGETAIGGFIDDRKAYLNRYLKNFRNLAKIRGSLKLMMAFARCFPS